VNDYYSCGGKKKKGFPILVGGKAKGGFCGRTKKKGGVLHEMSQRGKDIWFREKKLFLTKWKSIATRIYDASSKEGNVSGIFFALVCLIEKETFKPWTARGGTMYFSVEGKKNGGRLNCEENTLVHCTQRGRKRLLSHTSNNRIGKAPEKKSD